MYISVIIILHNCYEFEQKLNKLLLTLFVFMLDYTPQTMKLPET
jgi:hypothetical protein